MTALIFGFSVTVHMYASQFYSTWPVVRWTSSLE